MLYSLPLESAEKVLTALGPVRSERLRSELAKLRQQGDPPSDVGDVVRELEELLLQTDAAPPVEPTPRQLAAYRPPSDTDISLPPLPSDPVQALHALPPELLVDVLQGEQANTIALVLNDLPAEKAGGEVDPAQREREERQAIEQVLEQLKKSVDQFAASYHKMADEMRQAAIELAIAVAGRVVFDKLQAGEFPIEEMVRQALARLPAAPALTVYLHPDDLALLQRRLGDKPLLSARETQLRIEADASLRRGSCRAEAGEIHVRADLSDQLAGLRQHLLWSASHAQSGPGS